MAFPAAQVDSPRKRDLTCFLVRYTSRGSERLPRVGEFAGPSEAFRLGRLTIHYDTAATTLVGVARVQVSAKWMRERLPGSQKLLRRGGPSLKATLHPEEGFLPIGGPFTAK